MSRATTIAPEALRDFLTTSGWKVRKSPAGQALYVLEHPHLPKQSLSFPIDAQAPGYAQAVEQVLRQFAEALKQLP